jgi:thiol-disulfide isomerase/thioredoxin
MFLKKDRVSQNHLPVFIIMAVVTFSGIGFSIYKAEKNKQKHELEYKQAVAQEKNKVNVENKDTKKSKKKPNEAFNDILAKNQSEKKVLFFYASWNSDSYVMMENIKEILKDNKPKKEVVVLEVEGSDAVKTNVEDSGNITRITLDSPTIPAKYLVDAVPTIIVLANNNTVLATNKGKMTYEEIKSLLLNN